MRGGADADDGLSWVAEAGVREGVEGTVCGWRRGCAQDAQGDRSGYHFDLHGQLQAADEVVKV